MKNLYRTTPSDSLVLNAVRSVGLDDLNDVRWFDESFFNPDSLLVAQVLAELEVVMFPCFYREYVQRPEPLTHPQYICLVRQLLKSRHMRLDRKDKKFDKGAKIRPSYRISLESIPGVVETATVSLSA